jgi:hypothetical protein
MLLSVVVLQVLRGWAHSVERLSADGIKGHLFVVSQCIDMCVQEACEGGTSYFAMNEQGVLTCISVWKELCNGGSA